MKKLNKLTLVLAKIFELVHWIGAAMMVLVIILSFFTIGASTDVKNFLEIDTAQFALDYDFNVYGFEVSLANSAGEINMATVILYFIGATIIMGLMAMVFRNIYLIIKTLEGKNKHTQSATPFQKDVIRMLKEIGIFSISVPLVGFLISFIIFAVSILTGSAGTEISINLQGFIVGLISLCLTNIFTYGAELEKDIDGLL